MNFAARAPEPGRRMDMISSRLLFPRSARLPAQEQVLLLAILLAGGLAIAHLAGLPPSNEPRPLLNHLLISLGGLLQCSGLLVLLGFSLAALELLKQTITRLQIRRAEARLAWLREVSRSLERTTTPASFRRVLGLLNESQPELRQQALLTAYQQLRLLPELGNCTARQQLVQALLEMPGFAATLAHCPPDADLLYRVTLGAKLGAGTASKRLAPVTSVPLELACWVEQYRYHLGDPEIQISIGYDTGFLPSLCERGRFLAFYLFIATTDLQRFQALLRRPPRDPNAAYGLLIRGDLLEVRFPGQARGHRLDYVFPLPVRLSTPNLAGLFREIQLLNLGLLLGCVADTCRVLAGNQPLPWLDERRLAIAGLWRDFERRLVALLRRYDRYRDPQLIHRLQPGDDYERRIACERYRLEESLYPHYGWVVPLYDPDTRWDRLLLPLRGVEAMMLHQGEVEGRDLTRGAEFIRQVRQLGYQTSTAIAGVLAGELPTVPNLPADPFIDPAEEEATRWYLTQVRQAIARGETSLYELPDPSTFRQALAYYDIGDSVNPAYLRSRSEEVDP
jgi:hypothetical protein